MGIVALVVLMVSGLYIFLSREMKEWKSKIRIENMSHVLAHRLAEDIRASRLISSSETGTSVLISASDDTVRYALRDGRLSRNGKLMHQEIAMVDTFSMVGIERASPTPLPTVVLHLSINDGTRRVSLKSTIGARPYSGWQKMARHDFSSVDN